MTFFDKNRVFDDFGVKNELSRPDRPPKMTFFDKNRFFVDFRGQNRNFRFWGVFWGSFPLGRGKLLFSGVVIQYGENENMRS